MTVQSKNGFVALWHNVPPQIDEEYNLVHTREHVPDYVANAAGRGGIDFGRRYSNGEGQLPRYFMLYPAKDMSAFAILAERPWVQHPGGTSDWFNAIIDQYRDSWRNNCRMLGQIGGGTGGSALSLIMTLPSPSGGGSDIIQGVLQELIAIPSIVAVRLGVTDPEIQPNRPELTVTHPPVGVMVVESFSHARLAQAIPSILEALSRRGLCADEPRFALYQLAYELRPEALDDIRPFAGHRRRW